MPHILAYSEKEEYLPTEQDITHSQDSLYSYSPPYKCGLAGEIVGAVVGPIPLERLRLERLILYQFFLIEALILSLIEWQTGAVTCPVGHFRSRTYKSNHL